MEVAHVWAVSRASTKEGLEAERAQTVEWASTPQRLGRQPKAHAPPARKTRTRQLRVILPWTVRATEAFRVPLAAHVCVEIALGRRKKSAMMETF